MSEAIAIDTTADFTRRTAHLEWFRSKWSITFNHLGRNNHLWKETLVRVYLYLIYKARYHQTFYLKDVSTRAILRNTGLHRNSLVVALKQLSDSDLLIVTPSQRVKSGKWNIELLDPDHGLPFPDFNEKEWKYDDESWGIARE